MQEKSSPVTESLDVDQPKTWQEGVSQRGVSGGSRYGFWDTTFLKQATVLGAREMALSQEHLRLHREAQSSASYASRVGS